ncbi:Fic/DOC family protein [Achromobacter aegrifaciens]
MNIWDDSLLAQAEQELSEIAASQIDLFLPPYDLAYLKRLHRTLFQDLYDRAGELRTIDISKGGTRFCNTSRIEPEADKIFAALARANWFKELPRSALIAEAAVAYGDLNMIHPFREGNGRAQRLLFEHLIINAGYEISWWSVEQREWVDANVAAVICDYAPLEAVFQRCVGQPIAD